MKTISVQMSEVEYDTLGLSKDRFYFSEIAGLIERQIMRKSSIAIADKVVFQKTIPEKRQLGILNGKARIVFKDDFEMTTEELLGIE